MSQEAAALDEVRSATNEELITRLRRLVRADQTLTAQLLVHLGEVEARRLYREQAYSSMFAYCVEELRMFEHQAYLRIQAARLARQFPHVLQLLAQGALSLTAIKQLAPHLTPDNHVNLLERARGKHTREIALLVAAIAPKPDAPSRMRKLPRAGFAVRKETGAAVHARVSRSSGHIVSRSEARIFGRGERPADRSEARISGRSERTTNRSEASISSRCECTADRSEASISSRRECTASRKPRGLHSQPPALRRESRGHCMHRRTQ